MDRDFTNSLGNLSQCLVNSFSLFWHGLKFYQSSPARSQLPILLPPPVRLVQVSTNVFVNSFQCTIENKELIESQEKAHMF